MTKTEIKGHIQILKAILNDIDTMSIKRVKERINADINFLEIAYYELKHTEGYSYNKLRLIAHNAYLRHKHILKDRAVYERLEQAMLKRWHNA
jgi:hypothetical protein